MPSRPGRQTSRLPLASSSTVSLSLTAAIDRPTARKPSRTLRNSSPDCRSVGDSSSVRLPGRYKAVCRASAATAVDLPDCRQQLSKICRAEDDSSRFLSDTIVTWTVSPSLSLMANYDYGRDRLAGATVSWSGVAAYARLQVTNGWALSSRFERLNDGDGFMTGTPQTVKELTLTSEYKAGGALLARLEYRRDFSDQPFFLRGEEKVRSQDTVTLGLVYGFSFNP